MSRIDLLHQFHDDELEHVCKRNMINFNSMKRLVEVEKTKKILRRNTLIQTLIDREIDNSLDNEN